MFSVPYWFEKVRESLLCWSIILLMNQHARQLITFGMKQLQFTDHRCWKCCLSTYTHSLCGKKTFWLALWSFSAPSLWTVYFPFFLVFLLFWSYCYKDCIWNNPRTKNRKDVGISRKEVLLQVLAFKCARLSGRVLKTGIPSTRESVDPAIRLAWGLSEDQPASKNQESQQA
jgi:hypothetical protein